MRPSMRNISTRLRIWMDTNGHSATIFSVYSLSPAFIHIAVLASDREMTRGTQAQC